MPPIVLVLLFQHLTHLDMPATASNPYTSTADLDQGRKLYAGRCAGCHGPTGDGGKGANLAIPTLSRAQTDLALYTVIRYGLPETEMPSHNLTQREIWQLAAFVRSLGARGQEGMAGDAGRGGALVRGKGGCLQCHIVNGEGGNIGPSLTDVGRRRSPAYLRAKLIDPSVQLGDEFRMVKLRTRTGQNITGVRMNEDNWSIQLRDQSGRLYSFQKQDLAELAVERRTVMPSYAKVFSEGDLADVVSFLMSAGGRQ